MKKSGFVNPMALRQELVERTGASPLQLEPAAEAGPLKEEKQEKKPEVVQVSSADPLPWLNAHPKVKIHFGLRIPEKLHKQFEYAANHTLGDSMQTFALRALEEAVVKRLKELGVG